MRKKYVVLHVILFAVFLPLLTFAQTREELQKVQQYINEGFAATERKDYSTAIESYTKALTLYQKSPEIYYNRGTLYTFTREYDLAIKDFDKAIELGKNLDQKRLSQFYMNRGLVFQTKGNYEMSVNDLNQAASLNSEDVRIFINRANTYALLKKDDLAIADLNKALEIAPHPLVFYNRGRLHYQKREFNQAIRDFTKAVEMDAQLVDAYNARGLSNQYNGNTDAALQDFTKAISLAENDGINYFNRGNLLFKKERYDAAIADYTKAIAIFPLWAEAFRYRAEVYKKIGKMKLAEEDLLNAEKVKKENFEPKEKAKILIP